MSTYSHNNIPGMHQCHCLPKRKENEKKISIRKRGQFCIKTNPLLIPKITSILVNLVSEDDAELGRVGANRGVDLPAAGLEVFGDGAITGERHLVVRSCDGAELEDGHAGVWRSRNLHRTVHSRHLRGWFSRGIGSATVVRLHFRFRLLPLPPPQ